MIPSHLEVDRTKMRYRCRLCRTEHVGVDDKYCAACQQALATTKKLTTNLTTRQKKDLFPPKYQRP